MYQLISCVTNTFNLQIPTNFSTINIQFLLILLFLSSQFLHWLPCLPNPRPSQEHILSGNRSFWESRLSTFLQLSFPVRSCIHFLSPCDIISLLNKERR
nr:MAG TPA: hypothetical protein [Caudoviricetes sp.]